MERHLRYAKDLWRAGRKYRLSPLITLGRFYRLAIGAKFSPNEIFRLGLLDRDDGFARMSRSVSKETLLALQRTINPARHFHLTEDKIDFAAACHDASLPTPPLLAVLSPGGRGGGGAAKLRDPQALAAWLDRQAPRDVVVKPAAGTHGDGVMVLSRDERGHWDAGTGSLTSEAIAARVAASDYRDWLVQPRLFGARELAALSGTDLLQTSRVVTLASDAGVRVLLAWLRITAGPSRSDNFNFGAAGHLVAPVDVATGRLGTPARMSADGFGLEPAPAHPRTGRPIEGFVVPHWQAVRALAERAARAFAPLATIGWDVAITDDGPSLVEGNVTWDPLPANPGLPAALRALQQAAPRAADRSHPAR